MQDKNYKEKTLAHTEASQGPESTNPNCKTGECVLGPQTDTSISSQRLNISRYYTVPECPHCQKQCKSYMQTHHTTVLRHRLPGASPSTRKKPQILLYCTWHRTESHIQRICNIFSIRWLCNQCHKFNGRDSRHFRCFCSTFSDVRFLRLLTLLTQFTCFTCFQTCK